MKQHKDVLIENLIEKSDKAFRDIKIGLENQSLEIAQNRMYYAIFYIVSALAYSKEFTTSKHSQLLGWFNKKIIHEEKIFPTYLFEIYKKTYENRTKSDYELTYKPSREKVEENYKRVEEFIYIIQDYIKKQTNG